MITSDCVNSKCNTTIMNTEMEEDILCRSCLTIIKKYKQQYDERVIEKFCFCTNIVISENDELTKQFCCECVIKIESSYNYVKEAHRVDQILRSQLSSSNQSITEANKQEHFEKDIPRQKTEREQYSLLGILLSNTNVDISSPSSLISDYENNTFNHHDNNKEIFDNQVSFENNELIFDTNLQSKICEKKDMFKTEKTSSSPCLKQNEDNDHSEFCKETFDNSTKSCLTTVISSTYKNKCKNNFSKVCEPCKKKFKMKHAYDEHMKRHNGKQNICERCNKEFQSVYKLQDHRYLCLKETFAVVCTHCGLKFRNQTKLQLHVTSKHSQERPYCCDICSKQFKFKRILEQHMVTHSNVKPFLCDVCGLSLTKANSLKEHRKTHSTEKPYKCEVCEFRARKTWSLTRHQLAHAGERRHHCAYCPRQFYVAFELKQHMRKHTGELPYNCPLCSRKFINSTKRKEHMVRAHKIALSDIPRMNKNGDAIQEPTSTSCGTMLIDQ